MGKQLASAQWLEIARRIFCAWGTPDDIALCVADSLVDSDLAGVVSHGMRRVPHYYDLWKAGSFDPSARAEVITDLAATAIIDGHWGFGPPTAHKAMNLAIEKSREYGIGAVGVIHSGHIGRLGQFVEAAAKQGAIGLLAASEGPPGGLVVPYGGLERVFSTNPIAASVPAREHIPFVMDFATSTVAAGKIQLAPDRDQRIPEGWAIDAQGQPATTPREFLDGGGLLPFGGHKGYALALLVELLCGALTGAGCTRRPEETRTLGKGGNACLAVALDIAHFVEASSFHTEVDGLLDRLKRVKAAPGFDEIVIPGEPEARQRSMRESEGISVDDLTWQKILFAASESGVNLGGFD